MKNIKIILIIAIATTTGFILMHRHAIMNYYWVHTTPVADNVVIQVTKQQVNAAHSQIQAHKQMSSQTKSGQANQIKNIPSSHNQWTQSKSSLGSEKTTIKSNAQEKVSTQAAAQ